MDEERVQRRLAAILAADVVSYSRLMEADEVGTLARLKSLRRTLFEPKTKQYGGRIFKTTGDGALVEFKSAIDAVNSAVDIQQALAELDEDITEDRRIRLRIGVSLGDVIVEGNDLYGNGVNVASRLEGIAEPGGVCVSGNVHEHVKTAPGLAFDDLGEQKVKNIERPVRIYRVVHGAAAAPGAEGVHKPARAERPGIAVLPFANMSGDADQEYFADGIGEEIITGLARIRGLTVIARNSTFAYKGSAPDIRKVGKDLDVRYVLEGSVRKAGDRVRITAQLVDAETGGHLWADHFDGSLADVFDLQDQITADVVAAIEPSVRRAEIERARRKRPENLNAYDLYLRAIDLVHAYTPQGREQAIPLLEAAIALEPGYAEAHGLAAWCLMQKFLFEGRAPKDREAGLRHAESVVAARTDESSALAMAARAIGGLGGNLDVALGMVDQALTLNPSCAVAHNVGAQINSRLARYDLSRVHAERSLRLSPFDPQRYIPEHVMGIAGLAEADIEGALGSLRRALIANPDFVPSRALEAVCLFRLGRLDEARTSLGRVLECAPETGAAALPEQIWSVDPALLEDIITDLREIGLPA